MPNQPRNAVDCLVIGGGAPGLISAWTLLRSGRNVTVIDNNHPSASAVGAGILSPLPPWRYSPHIRRLAQDGAAAYPSLLETLADDCEYRRVGMAVLPPHEECSLKPWLAAESSAIRRCAAELSPALAAEQQGKNVVFLPAVAYLRPPRLLAALRRNLGWRRLIGAVTSLKCDNGRVTGVNLADGSAVAAGEIVLSAGAWSEPLCPPPTPAILPMRGQILRYPPTCIDLAAVLLEEKNDFYLLQLADGSILAGSTLEDTGFDETPTTAAAELLRQRAAKLLPALSRQAPVEHAAGLRPMAVGGKPVIGRHPAYENLYLNSGHFRYGLTMAPAAAKLLLHCMDNPLYEGLNNFRFVIH